MLRVRASVCKKDSKKSRSNARRHPSLPPPPPAVVSIAPKKKKGGGGGGGGIEMSRKTKCVLMIYLFVYSAAAGLMPTMASTCQQDSLTRCTDPLKVLTNNRDLGFAATKHELNSLCP